jgi:flagellar protein FliT
MQGFGASGSTIDHYRDIARLSTEMLRCAELGQWTDVAKLSALCDRRIAALEKKKISSPLNREEDAERMRLLHGIIQDDAKIRYLANPWSENLTKLMSGRGTWAGETDRA